MKPGDAEYDALVKKLMRPAEPIITAKITVPGSIQKRKRGRPLGVKNKPK